MRTTDKEDKKELERKKQLAILKASNELLEESKRKVLDNKHLDDDRKNDIIEQISTAQEENFKKAAANGYGTREDILNAQYKDVSQEYVDKYNRRLEKRGLTDEQISRKGQADVVTAEVDDGKRKRKHIKRSERKKAEEVVTDIDEQITPIDNEDELMRLTMIKDGTDMDDFNRKRQGEIENNLNKRYAHDAKTFINDVAKETAESKKVKPKETDVAREEVKPRKKVSTVTVDSSYNFDFSSIPSNVQYDMIPLPSNGECYPQKCSRLPVAYLTAKDEDIIASPNMYRDGKIIDVILSRKILDKSIKVEDLCKGDRDAIVLWLRATGYGTDFPVVVTNPKNGHKYDIAINLNNFKYLPFTLKGNERGYFEYTLSNGDVLEFKFLSKKDEEMIREAMVRQNTDVDMFEIMRSANVIESSLERNDSVSDEIKEDLMGCVEDIKEILKEVDFEETEIDEMYTSSVTELMLRHTVSVNGNSDPEYVKEYVENMRSKDAYEYRSYMVSNRPGVNFKVTVNIPESDGGGSFDTFLRLDDTVFINV